MQETDPPFRMVAGHNYNGIISDCHTSPWEFSAPSVPVTGLFQENPAMFGVNSYELLIVLVIALLLFGSRLPSVMRSLGKSVTEFKKGINDVDDDAKKPDNLT